MSSFFACFGSSSQPRESMGRIATSDAASTQQSDHGLSPFQVNVKASDASDIASSRNPCIVLTLKAASPSSSASEDMIQELPLNNQGWLTCHLSSLNASAREALRIALQGPVRITAEDIHVVKKALNGLIKSSPHVLKGLSDAALSVASPSISDAREARAELTLPDCKGWPGASLPQTLRIFGSFFRNAGDFSLIPSLIIEVSPFHFQPSLICGLHSTANDISIRSAVRLSSASQRHIGEAEKSGGRSLLRAGAMISAIPCIATLMELHPTSDDFYSSPGQLFSGRILMQNELSLAYWGKLDQMDHDGSWLIVKTLFASSMDVVPDMIRQLSEQRQRKADRPDDLIISLWKNVVKVVQRMEKGRPSGDFSAHQASVQPCDPIFHPMSPLPDISESIEKTMQIASAFLSTPGHVRRRPMLTLTPTTEDHPDEPLETGQPNTQLSFNMYIPKARSFSQASSEEEGEFSAGGVRLRSETEYRSFTFKDRELAHGTNRSSVTSARDLNIDTTGMAVRPSKQLMSMLQAIDTGSIRGRTSASGPKGDATNDIVEYCEPQPDGTRAGAEGGNLYTKLTNDFGSVSARGVRSSNLQTTSVASARVSKLTPGNANEPPARADSRKNVMEEITAVKRIGTGLSTATSGAGEIALSTLSDTTDRILSSIENKKSVKIVLETDTQHPQPSNEEIRWHEVQAVPVQDPVTGKDAVLLLQTDITTRAIMEQRMAALTESQLSMLEEMFPRHVLEFIMGAAPPEATLGDLAYQHDDVTILFMDIVGFTSMSKEVPPQMVMEFLNSLFSKFDLLLDEYNVYKVETAGDCYIVAGALMVADEEGFMVLDGEGDARDGARNVILFAQAMLSHARTICMPHNGQPTCVRVGVHTGSVVSGLIGSKLPKFSLFGDTMNTSSRMESTSRPGCIQVSESTYAMLEEDQRSLFEATGGVEVKGKGLMPTYIYQYFDYTAPLPLPLAPSKAKAPTVSFEDLLALRKDTKQGTSGALDKKAHSSRLHQGPPTKAAIYPMSFAALGVKLGANEDEHEDEDVLPAPVGVSMWSGVTHRLNAIAGGSLKQKTSPRQGPQSAVAISNAQPKLMSAAKSQFEMKSSVRDFNLGPMSMIESQNRGSSGHKGRSRNLMSLGQHLRDIAAMESHQDDMMNTCTRGTGRGLLSVLEPDEGQLQE